MDPKWEFNANQFVDFNNIQDQNNSNADEFFDFNMETGERVADDQELAETKAEEDQKSAEELEASDQPVPATSTGLSGGSGGSLGTPYVVVSAPESREVPEDHKKRRPVNLVTSWGPKATKLKVTASEGGLAAKPVRRSSPSPSLAPQLPPKSNYVKQHQASLSTGSSGGARRPSPALPSRPITPRRAALKLKVEAAVASARSSPRLAKIVPKRLGTNTRAQLSGAKTPELAKYQGKTTAAMARTPEVMRKYKTKLSQGQHAIRSMMDTQSFRNKLAGRKEKEEMTRAKESAEKRIAAVKPVLTKPVEFNFSTASRVKSSSASKTSGSETPDFTRSLRSYSRPGLDSAGVTQPVPFKLAARKRRHSADPANKFQSQAEMVEKFHSGTPDRFRSKPKPRPRSVSPGKQMRVTIPQTPQLMTRGRSRPQVASQQELEEQELAKIRAKKFSARPAPSAATGVSGLPERMRLPVVEPQSPAFVLKGRMAERKTHVEPEPEPVPVVKARPAPHRGVPVLLPPMPRKSTQPAPFSFETRDKLQMEKKEEKIQKILEEERKAREFHANPIMKEEAVKVPARQPPAATKVEPFKLAIEERVEERLTKWQASVQKELEEQRKAALFKATDPKVLSRAPFEPKPSEKPLSEVSNFSLHSDRRAEERSKFEIKLKQKEAEIEGAKRELELRRKREEEEEVQRLRREAVPRANPIRNYKPLEIAKSERPLTNPASPNWVAKTKAVNSTYTTNQN